MSMLRSSMEFIQPSSEVRGSRYELSGLDRIMQFVPYQKRILFYSVAALPWEEIIHTLRKSLAETLVAFYSLAGRMRSGNGVEDPALELDCRELPGVRFTCASTGSTLAHAGEDCMPSAFSELLCDVESWPQYPWTPDAPLMFIQVTKFACGGISIGFTYSHQLIDASSAWWFMNSWAQLARTGECVEAPEVTYGYAERNGSEVSQLPPRNPPEELKADPKLGLKQYKLDRGAIDKLKLDADLEKSSSFSTFVVACAHFWTKVVAAKDLPDSNTCRFMVLVDCRGRIESLQGLKNYFGNAIWSTVATATSGELKSNSHQGFMHAATLLHEAIAAFDSKTAEEKFHQRRRLQPVPVVSGNSGVTEKEEAFTMVAVESPKLPIYECDFGFGKPDGVTFGMNDLHDGQLYMFPLKYGGVSVTVVLETQALDKLN